MGGCGGELGGAMGWGFGNEGVGLLGPEDGGIASTWDLERVRVEYQVVGDDLWLCSLDVAQRTRRVFAKVG